jgi:hypothetical protein
MPNFMTSCEECSGGYSAKCSFQPCRRRVECFDNLLSHADMSSLQIPAAQHTRPCTRPSRHTHVPEGSRIPGEDHEQATARYASLHMQGKVSLTRWMPGYCGGEMFWDKESLTGCFTGADRLRLDEKRKRRYASRVVLCATCGSGE